MENIPELDKLEAKRKIIIVFILTFVFMIVEVIVGVFANSLALLADAGHMLSDVFSLGLSVLAIILASRPRNPRFSFGYYRAEILAALFNGFSLIIISIFIVREAFQRFNSTGHEVLGLPMFVAAFIGLLINLYGLLALSHHSEQNLNIHSAFFHIAADLLGSIAAVVAGIMILITGNPIWDILLSVMITILILISGIKIIRRALLILMQASPENITSTTIHNSIMDLQDVNEVHDIHIWSMDQKRTMVSAHVVVSEGLCQHDRQDIMRNITETLDESYDIKHATIQIEHNDEKLKKNNCGCE